VRGQYALTPELQAELAELRSRVLLQQGELDKYRAAISDLQSGQDKYRLRGWAKARKQIYALHTQQHEDNVFLWEISVSWRDIFMSVAPKLRSDLPMPEIESSMVSLAWSNATDLDWPYASVVDRSSIQIAPHCLDDILVQLFALGVLERGVRLKANPDPREWLLALVKNTPTRGYWRLTLLGESTFLELRERQGQRGEAAARSGAELMIVQYDGSTSPIPPLDVLLENRIDNPGTLHNMGQYL
jgi:hypothetical protein